MTMITVKPEAGRVAVPRFSNIFENFFENEFVKAFTPAVNVKETKDSYLIDVIAPGFAKENFSVKVEEGTLTLSGDTATEQLQEGEKYTRKEFTHTSFKRSFSMPKTVVAENITATYENGILKVTLPKMEEAKAKGPVEVKIS